MITDQKNFSELVEKIEKLKKSGAHDLSTDEDLSIAVMNLVSLEEHLFFTAEKTSEPNYLNLMQEVREARKFFLGKLVPKHEGETWCISKHLLATVMRLIEVGTKLHHDKKEKEAKEVFDYAYKLYSIFWGLKLKLINIENVKEESKAEKPWTLKDIVNKLVDCCEE